MLKNYHSINLTLNYIYFFSKKSDFCFSPETCRDVEGAAGIDDRISAPADPRLGQDGRLAQQRAAEPAGGAISPGVAHGVGTGAGVGRGRGGGGGGGYGGGTVSQQQQ